MSAISFGALDRLFFELGYFGLAAQRDILLFRMEAHSVK